MITSLILFYSVILLTLITLLITFLSFKKEDTTIQYINIEYVKECKDDFNIPNNNNDNDH